MDILNELSQDPQRLRRRAKNRISRTFHCTLAVVYLLLLSLTLGALVTFANIHSDISTNSIYGREFNGKYGTCILYSRYPCATEDTQKKNLCLSSGSVCGVAIAAEAGVAIVALGMCIVSIGRAVAGVRAINIFVLVELLVVVFALVVGLSTSSIISAGVAYTCKAVKDLQQKYFKELVGIDTDVPCCTYSIPAGSEGNSRLIFFFEPLLTTQITAWISTSILLLLVVVYTAMLVLYYMGRRRRQQLFAYVHHEDSPECLQPLPIAEDDISEHMEIETANSQL